MTGEIPSVDYSNATSEPNTSKNRYQNKIPCISYINIYSMKMNLFILDNHTRVHLRAAAAMGSDYINASFIEVCLIIVFIMVITLYQYYRATDRGGRTLPLRHHFQTLSMTSGGWYLNAR